MILILIFTLVLGATMFFPYAMFVLLSVNLALTVFLSISQIAITLLPRFQPRRKKITTQPFVSVLVPACNEPPAILMETLEKLSQIDYQNFEVLIIDNNTKDKAVWEPVKNFAHKIGPKFRFFHLDQLSGFKAGALNYGLKHVNPRTQYAAIIDADYVVRPDFLRTAISYFTDDKIALVQFPQQYSNTFSGNQPIADEYRHFFGIYMNMANYFDCVPSTGTVSVYQLEVLRNIDGFRKEALTEDADVGLRIYEAGYSGVYVDQPVGYGLMPYDLEAYRKQKWRWAYGNAQSIKTLFLLFGKIPFRSWFGFLLHLTAWDHLNFLPFGVLVAYSILLLPAVPLSPIHRQLLSLASLSIFATLAAKLPLFFATLRESKHFFVRSLKAFVIHMGMTLTYSEAWLAYLFQVKSAFERTNKFILVQMPSVIKNSFPELILGAWFATGAVEAILWGTRTITFLAFLVSSVILLSIYYVHWKISPTKFYSKRKFIELERKYKNFLVPCTNTNRYRYRTLATPLEKNPA